MGGANGEQAFFEEGDRVDAQYYKFEHWYPGRVTKLNANGTYVVEYDDGELEFNVSSVHLRKAQERGPHKIKGARTLKMRTHEVDLADGLSHYFIIEGEDNKAHFEQVFLSVITMNTPCLGFVTYGNEDNLKQIVDMVHRGLPLVLLDSRERYWTSPYIDVNDCKTYLAQKNLSFDPNSVARKLRGGLSLKSRERPYEDFFVAEQALKQHTEYLGAGGILELYENSTLAFLHALRTQARPPPHSTTSTPAGRSSSTRPSAWRARSASSTRSAARRMSARTSRRSWTSSHACTTTRSGTSSRSFFLGSCRSLPGGLRRLLRRWDRTVGPSAGRLRCREPTRRRGPRP